jgi:hypothetical protein
LEEIIIDIKIKKTNIICNQCGENMLTEFGLQFMSQPPKYKLVCDCGNTKYLPCSEVERLDKVSRE